MKRKFYVLTLLTSMLLSAKAFADEQDIPPPRDQGQWMSLVMIALAFVFIWLIMWRPEQKRRKALEQQRNTLQKGDRVTAVGIIGTVLRVQEQTVILKMYDGAKIEVLKAAISDVLPASEEDAKKADKEDRALSSNDTNSH
jgi:preprotein translocase subunit YajC